MRPKTLFVLATIVAACSALSAQTADPWIGTWKVNLAKSTYSQNPKPTVPSTVKIETSGAGIKTSIDTMGPQGTMVHTESIAAFDGKDVPVKGAQVPNTTVSVKRVDGRTLETVNKVDGKPTVTTRVVVAADGKSITATQTGKMVDGTVVNNVILLERQ